MELRDALDQIADIRAQVARTLVFRGYRSATTAFSAAVAVVTAMLQSVWSPHPEGASNRYLILWFVAAIVSLIAVGTEMALRCRRAETSLQREMSVAAAEQFLPCVVAGALLTYVLVKFAFDVTWMLPGLWMICFSLGVFSSRRLLPAATVLVGMYYLLAGLVVLAMGESAALRPWTMGGVFGAGQLLAAGILWWTLERGHG